MGQEFVRFKWGETPMPIIPLCAPHFPLCTSRSPLYPTQASGGSWLSAAWTPLSSPSGMAVSGDVLGFRLFFSEGGRDWGLPRGWALL